MQEIIFIGLPGPTHHFGGLAQDNVAAVANQGNKSHPAAAAKQALRLAATLHEMGVPVAILPPQLRPHMPSLRMKKPDLDDDALITLAAKEYPELLHEVSSSAAMWVANAATMTPNLDAADRNLHISPANLVSHAHRRIEADDNYKLLKQIFEDVTKTTVHPPLKAEMSDEGAANHLRLAPSHLEKGLNVFVYGEGDARQSLEASKAIKKHHNVPDAQALFVQQNPAAIAAGVFHNDVIAVSNESVLLVHEEAFANGRKDIETIEKAYAKMHEEELPDTLVIGSDQLTLEEAVATYFFNSQIVTLPDLTMVMIAPMEVKILFGGKAAKIIDAFIEDDFNPIDRVEYVDLRESMQNGGGPACLRLRVLVDDTQLATLKTKTSVVLNSKRLASLEKLVEQQYPQELTKEGLSDPKLYHQAQAIQKALEPILGLKLA